LYGASQLYNGRFKTGRGEGRERRKRRRVRTKGKAPEHF
jgi:hypothetical protein